MVTTFYHTDLEANSEVWRSDGLDTSATRQKIAAWAAAAWAILRTETDRIRSCFVATGFLIAQDGTEDHLIQIPNVPGYSFP